MTEPRTDPTQSAKSRNSGPPTAAPTEAGQAQELVRVVEAYLAELESGRQPDRARWVADYPALAPRLEEALAGLEFIHGANRAPASVPARLGDFRIVREVGRGGMGVVYEAEQISLRRRVALKVLRIGGVADEQALQRFQREAETVAALHHTNIVPIYAIGCEEGVRYYAMQFIEGEDLASLAAQARAGRRPTSADEVGRWGLQAAEALAHAHQHNVIHRDIKPSNLILDSTGRIWLTDFGLARRTDDVTLSLTGALLGTPRYMSPEQAGAALRPIDHRTDIYSLGATLYELATERPPFEGTSAHEILGRILSQEPLPPRRAKPTVPRDLETIILRCLAKDPAQRYATAQALADDLRAFLENRPIKARRPSPVEQVVRWARKHRRTTTVAGWSAIASTIAIAAVIFSVRLHRDSQLGHIALSTEDRRLQAEILEPARDRVVAPSFSLPTRQPVAVAAGDYRLRLASPGHPGQDLLLRVDRRTTSQFSVGLDPLALFAPLTLDSQDLSYQAAIEGPPDLVIARRWGARRLDAATGEPIWTADLTPTLFRDQFRNVGEEQAWNNVLDHRPQGRPPALVQPPPDLDADGAGDLIWAGDAVPALLALSGRTGRLLWWHPVDPPPEPALTTNSRPHQPWWGSVVGAPALAHLDADNAPDLVACYASDQRHWLEGISGRTGAILWRLALNADWFHKPSWSHRELLFPPTLTPVNGRTQLVVCATTQLLLVSPETGQLLRQHPLPHAVIQDPRLADLNADGTHEALLLGERKAGDLILAALDIATGRVLWTRAVSARFNLNEEQDRIIPWPLTADLDHDQQPEVLVPAVATLDSSTRPDGPHWSALDCLRGLDGSLRWRRELARSNSPYWVPQANHFLPGPDVDGDGTNDVLTASLHLRSFREGHTSLRVDALSGANGRGVWHWERTVTNRCRPRGLAWGQTGTDGTQDLLVATVLWPNLPGDLYILGVSKGDHRGTLSAAEAPTTFDADGDGLLELVFRSAADRPPTGNGAGTLHGLRGLPPFAWARLAASPQGMQRLGDADGDGVDDVVLDKPLSAYSGATGQTLWRFDDSQGTSIVLPLPEGDLDGDTVPEIVTMRSGHMLFESRTFSPASLIHGRTGRRLWEANLPTQSCIELYQAHAVQPAPGVPAQLLLVAQLALDQPLVQIAGAPTLSNQVWLVSLDPNTGNVLWRRPLTPELPPGPGSGSASWPCVVTDLEADGSMAIVTPALTDPQTWELRTYHLQQGQLRWQHPLHTGPNLDPHQLLRQIPHPVVADLDADRKPEVVVVDLDTRRRAAADTLAYTASVIALSGTSGALRWTWSWVESAQPFPPASPLVVRGLDRTAHVVVLTRPPSGPEAVRLDRLGVPVSRLKPGIRAWSESLHVADLEGDGADELLWIDERNALLALRGDLTTTLWTWPATSLHSVLPSQGGNPATVVVQWGSDLLGLDAIRGESRWRVRGTELLFHDARPGHLPLVASPEGGATEPGRAWVCRRALPTLPSGTYHADP